METILVNLIGAPRRERKHGRDYLIVPATSIVSGVLVGSQGPLYYPPEEIARDPSLWDGMPIVVQHPVRNGLPVSARDPDILDASEVGRVFRSRSEDGKLRHEMRIDVEATRRIDSAILAAIEAGRTLEISTGVYTTNEPAPAGATHNGKPYTFIARNYRPDHIAILPGGTGACAIKDGCGLNVNAGANEPSHSDLRRRLGELVEKRFGSGSYSMDAMPTTYVADVFDRSLIYERDGKTYEIGYTTDLRAGTVALAEGPPVEVRRQTSYKPVGNSVRSECNDFCEDECDGVGDEEGCVDDCMEECLAMNSALSDAQRKSALSAMDAADGDSRVAANASKIATKKGTAEAHRVAGRLHAKAMKTVTGGLRTHHILMAKEHFARVKGQTMNRAEVLAKLTANCKCEQDKAALNSLSDETLALLAKEAETKETPPPPVVNAAPPATPPVAQPVLNRLTAEEQEDLAFARAEKTRQKQRLVDQLTANVADAATKQAAAAKLMAKGIDELNGLLLLLPPTPAQSATPTLNYWGAATPPPAQAKDDRNNTLPTFTIDWDAMAAEPLRQKQSA